MSFGRQINAHGNLKTFVLLPSLKVGWDSSVGIATRYGLDGPAIESRLGGGARFSTTVQIGPVAQPAYYTGAFKKI